MYLQRWGGEVDFIHKHEDYWSALVSITEDRRKQDITRWEKLGGRIGLSEWDIKGGFEGAMGNGDGEVKDATNAMEVEGPPEAEL